MEEKWDGKMGMWPFVIEELAKILSKNHEKGTMIMNHRMSITR